MQLVVWNLDLAKARCPIVFYEKYLSRNKILAIRLVSVLVDSNQKQGNCDFLGNPNFVVLLCNARENQKT